MDKNRFSLDKRQIHTAIETLSIEERGELLSAIDSYNQGEDYTPTSPKVEFAFGFIKVDLDNEAEKQEELSKIRAEAGRKGGVAKSQASPCFKPDLSFIEDDEKRELFTEWLDYKKARKESYKTQKSVELMYNKLEGFAEGNPIVMKQLIEESMANNYQGIIDPSKRFNGRNNGLSETRFEKQKREDQQLADALARRCAENFEREQAVNRGEDKIANFIHSLQGRR